MVVDMVCHLSNSNQSGNVRIMEKGDVRDKLCCHGGGSTDFVCMGLIFALQTPSVHHLNQQNSGNPHVVFLKNLQYW